MQTFEYQWNGECFRGELATGAPMAGKRPGVLVVHEAWGLSEHVKERAGRLADLGYVALAVDMYGEGKHAPDVQSGLDWTKRMRADLPTLRGRIRAAFDALRALPEVDDHRIAAIGFCFGGTTAIELARSGAPVAAVVSFHGGLDTLQPAEPGKVTAKILSLTGADDPLIPMEKVTAFMAEMDKAGADAQTVVYSGTKHSYTNPQAGEKGLPALAYNPVADRRSWKAMESLFSEVFG